MATGRAAAEPKRRPASRRVAGAALLLAALLLGLAWWWRSGAAPLPRRPGLDVIVISIDTLRADALGAWGRADAETPRLDRLAAQGVRFAQARAHNVVTLPSHANLLAGRLPTGHGIRDNSGFRFPPSLPTLATLLRDRGYRTGGFVSAFVLDSRFGLARGFDVYDDAVGGGAGAGAFEVPERSAPETVAAALRWLQAAEGRPSFLFLHLYEPHAPYDPPEPFASRFSDRPYLGEVAAVDAALEPLLRPILDGRGARDAVVVFTSDHGEGLGDHGEMTHGVFAYEETLRVPLVIHAPGLLEPGVVEDPVRHVDVLPTLLALLGIEAPAGLAGRSLLPLAVGRSSPAEDTYFEALSPSLERGWAPLRGVVSGGLKYVDLPIPELYDLERDPAERDNLAEERPGELQRLGARLARFGSGEAAAQVEEDAATRERLRALGYLAGGGAPKREGWGPEDDPKALIRLERREAEILRLVRLGELEAARRLCLESLAERPDMSLTWTQLLSIERGLGRLDAAAEAGRRALALRPDDAATAALLAGTLVDAGRPEEAREVLAPFLARADPDADLLNAEGMALARLGRPAEALETFERARRADPQSATALVNAGTLHLMRGDATSAERAFRAALAVDARAAAAHNGLGVIAARDGRAEEAVEHWRRAVDADPGDYRTLFNLGATLLRLGRGDEARPVLEEYLRRAPGGSEARDVERVRGWLAELG